MTGHIGMIAGNCSQTGATSTLGEATHRFGNDLTCILANVNGTNTLTRTVSGTTITFTGTDNDVVHFQIWGY